MRIMDKNYSEINVITAGRANAPMTAALRLLTCAPLAVNVIVPATLFTYTMETLENPENGSATVMAVESLAHVDRADRILHLHSRRKEEPEVEVEMRRKKNKDRRTVFGFTSIFDRERKKSKKERNRRSGGTSRIMESAERGDARLTIRLSRAPNIFRREDLHGTLRERP